MHADEPATPAAPGDSERAKMLSGRLYRAGDPQLAAARLRARRLMRKYNNSAPDDPDRRRQLLDELFGRLGSRAEIEPPFYCDYGKNIAAGDGVFMNFNCVVLDCAPVTIGDNAFFGPGVHIYAAFHPIDPTVRSSGLELARPVRIGSDVWIGGAAVICPGVTIGDGSTIGAGSVVIRDIPARVIAAGNPCRVIRSVDA